MPRRLAGWPPGYTADVVQTAVRYAIQTKVRTRMLNTSAMARFSLSNDDDFNEMLIRIEAIRQSAAASVLPDTHSIKAIRDRFVRLQDAFADGLEDLWDAQNSVTKGWHWIVKPLPCHYPGLPEESVERWASMLEDIARLTWDVVAGLPPGLNATAEDWESRAREIVRTNVYNARAALEFPGAPGLPHCPLGVAGELVPFFQAMFDEGVQLSTTKCEGMLVGLGELPPFLLRMAPENIEEIAYEISADSSAERAYDKAVCRYLTAIDKALDSASKLCEFFDGFAPKELRDLPDEAKLDVLRTL